MRVLDAFEVTQADSPARRIMDLLARRGPMTVAELVDTLGVTTTAVRLQVNRMVWEGWLSRSKRRGGSGRPADVLTLTDEARERYGQRTGEFLRLLLEEIVAVEGRGKLHDLLGRVQQRMAAALQREVGSDGSPAERLRRLGERMSDEGIVVETNARNGDVALTIFTCPYPDLAGKHREICEMERQTVSELVGGSVELDQCMLDGHLCCEFKAAS